MMFFVIICVERGISMYDINEYRKKKEEENIYCVVDMILENIYLNIDDYLIYKTNFFITGYNNYINLIIEKVKEELMLDNINIDFNIVFVPTSSTNIITEAYRNDSLFLKFMKKEDIFYNRINNNELIFDIKNDKLNTLYIMHALKTAFYHAGYDNMKLIINDKVDNVDVFNMTKSYIPKIVLLDMIKYNNKIEEDRVNNIKSRMLIK